MKASSYYKKAVRIELAKAELQRSNQYCVAAVVGLIPFLSILLLVSARWGDSGRWEVMFWFTGAAVVLINLVFFFFAFRLRSRAINELQALFEDDVKKEEQKAVSLADSLSGVDQGPAAPVESGGARL